MRGTRLYNNLRAIAICVSNEYVPSDTIMIYAYEDGYYYIFTKTCDLCPAIKVYCDRQLKEISKIEVNGDYTDGRQEVQPKTLERIKSVKII